MGRSRSPGQSLPIPAGLGDAFFSIDPESELVLQCNVAAARLLGVEPFATAVAPSADMERPSAEVIDPPEICGQRWLRVLGGDAGSASVLAHAQAAGRRVSLPPFILRRADDRDIAVAGLLLPATSDAPTFSVLLWQILDEGELQIAEELAPSDTLAVLAVDQLRFDDHWGAVETARLMADIRGTLLEIVRTGDTVGAPIAAAIVLVLRDVDVEGARDICRALLSHLHRIHTREHTAVAASRICVGLAHMRPGTSTLSTLLAANNALLQAQHSSGEEPIRAAADDDQHYIVGRMLNSSGVFSEHPATTLAALQEHTTVARSAPAKPVIPPLAPIERNIEGYVVDNMEGAVDQALYLARLDIPVAIIGPAGTGKMYVARIIHDESGAAEDGLVAIDCRDFRSRSGANTRLARELAQSEGKTLVFKSPHLLHNEVQQKLARQISSRTLADVSPRRYLPQVKLIALFPEKLEVLIRRGELAESLASAFAGYPITVPPIKDRKQAVLRWAHKILGQEGVIRDRDMKGFTPDAEQAMLLYDWPGNISEMRQCIFDALEKTDKDWLTPVDLGLFKGINPDGVPYLPEPRPFLSVVQVEEGEDEAYTPSALEALHVALGEAVHDLLALNMIKPLGAWMEDDLVLAALDRYRGDLRRTAEFLHTKPRNISRWMPKIEIREDERNGSSLWQKPRRALREWVRESPQSDESPLLLMEHKLMAHVNEQAVGLSSAMRARILGVSTPTYLKRLRETEQS